VPELTRVDRLVYVTAFVPAPGRSIVDLAGAEVREMILSVSHDDGNGCRSFDLELLASTVPPEEREAYLAFLEATQRPQGWAAMEQPWPGRSLPDASCTYVLCTEAALDDVRKLISQATTSQSAIAELLQQARRLRAENQLILPAGANAAELYHRVLATDPDNVIAVQGLNEITSQVAATADGLLAQGQLGQVDSLISQATAAGLNADNINELRRRLDIERSRQENILENLQAATVLFEQGFVTAPPEDNAVARLRAIQQIDPGNPQANLLLRQSAERLVAVARDAYQYGMKPQAKQYLDLALTITPEVEEWVSLRDSWESE
jgi:tetratricopeptide (TPR) repeat protein